MNYPKQASLATRLGMPAVQPQPRPTVASAQADQSKLDAQRLAERVKELTQPNIVRPALIDPAEVELARQKFKTDIAVLAAIEAMADIRLSWLNIREGLKPIVVLTPGQKESAMNFFTTHPDKPVAPVVAPAPVAAPTAPAAPAQPQRPLTPDSGLLLRIAKAAEESAKTQVAILMELKGIRTLIESRPVGQAAPTATDTFKDFVADCIVMSYDDNGKATFKAKGPAFSKHGVRVWPEVLPIIGADPDALKPGPNPFGPKTVRALMEVSEEDGELKMKKVVGLVE